MKLVLYFCLFCIFIHCINADSFSILVQLSLFSLGELSFIIIGLIYINRKTKNTYDLSKSYTKEECAKHLHKVINLESE